MMKYCVKGVALAVSVLAFTPGAGSQQEATRVKALLTKDISSYAGRDLLINVGEVALLPGASVAKHRHPGPTFVYVLAGELESQIEGSAPKVYRAGESFYEDPRQLHMETKNMSPTEPVKLLVYHLSRKGEPLTEMEK